MVPDSTVGDKTVTFGSEKSPNSTPPTYSTVPPLEDNILTSRVDEKLPEVTADDISFVVLEYTSSATISESEQSELAQSDKTTTL